MKLRRMMAIAAVVVAVAGCAQSGASTNAPSGASESTAPSAVTESASPSAGATVASLTVWHLACDTDHVMGLYEAFEQESGIDLELVDIPCDAFETTTQTKWATGDRPDILNYHPNGPDLLQFNATENLQDLSDMAFVANSGTTYPGVGTLNGKVYAVVTHFPSIFGIFYNNTVFADAGLEPPKTFDDLSSICETLSGSGTAAIFEAGGSVWPTQILPFLYISESNVDGAYAKEITDRSAEINDPNGPMVKALSAYEGLQEVGCFNETATSGTNEDALHAVLDGTAAMTALHSDSYASLLEYAGDDAAKLDATVGFAPVSATKALGTKAYGPFGSFMAPITGDAAKEAAARSFIEFATGDGYQAMVDAGTLLPIINTATTPEGFSELQLSFPTAAEGAGVAISSTVPGFGNFGTGMTSILAGQKTPQAVADDLSIDVEQAMKAAGIPGW
jgi:raffinose/stachyose/melibiose transport system substrate-binding protein